MRGTFTLHEEKKKTLHHDSFNSASLGAHAGAVRRLMPMCHPTCREREADYELQLQGYACGRVLEASSYRLTSATGSGAAVGSKSGVGQGAKEGGAGPTAGQAGAVGAITSV